MKRLFLTAIFICSISEIGFSQIYSGKESEINAILKNVKLFSEYYTSGNYKALAQSYSENGKILPPGPKIIEGRDAIEKRWTLPDGIKVSYHKITPTEITINGMWAYDIGYYEGKTIKADDSEVNFKGKYIIVWKKESGGWKIYADAWNHIN